ncbi:oligosaccharide repeat unit polymerase [Gelidibacter maritimus]|uniref:Oligosaccharide repeat unit polymerase n=1 Tax=Gelidibacter maritimus TaxID=2761487 RepID=A0A7W2M3A1_9FLAO|nr:oligosaccharide repeat unit polymerase [Gelidibacter maritimus]MBA6151929.1 oligosaccharide repeat unit polymerase [Gelidibacter maritimus]
MGVINPIKLLLISFLIWFLIYIQIPVKYLYTGNLFFPLLTLFLFITSFICGIISLKTSSVKSLLKPRNSKIKQIVYVLFLMGLLGVMLKIYAGFFNSKIFVSDNIFEQRIENMDKELTGGYIGVIGAILFPFSFVSLLMVLYNYRIFSNVFILFSILVGSYPFVETIFMGGRTIIALLGTTLVFVLIASYSKNARIPMKRVTWFGTLLFKMPTVLFKKRVSIPLVLIGIVFISYSFNVVNTRLKRFGYGNKTLKVWERKDYQWVEFNKDFLAEYYKAGNEEQAKMIGLYSLKHYFAHGVVEYIRMVNHLDYSTGYYYGQYEFDVFFKFFRSFGVPLKSGVQMQSILKRKAVYSTFFGPFYIDFGFFGVVILFFWGRFTKRVYIHAQDRNTEYVVFYGYLATIIITSAFINFLLGSSSYYLFAFFISLLLFKFWPNRLVLKREP